MIKKDVFHNFGYYATRYAQDYDLILRAKQRYTLANMSRCLCLRVQKKDSITAKRWRAQESIAFKSKMRYHARLDAASSIKLLAWLYTPMNLMRFCVSSKLKTVYNKYRGLPLPQGFDSSNLDDLYRLLDSVNRL
jgi:hypothetical protein